MDTSFDISLQFERGSAYFRYRLDAADALGKRFHEYRCAVGDDDGASPAKQRPQVPDVVFCCGMVRALTQNQWTQFRWIVEYQGILVESIGQLVRSYYCSPRWMRWKPGDYIGRIPCPPTIPEGFVIEDLLRISHIVLAKETPEFGVAVAVAWSDDALGIRFSHQDAVMVGEDSVAFL